MCVQLISVAFEHSVLRTQEIYGFYTPYRLQCKTLHFPKHRYLVYTTWNVQTKLKSTVLGHTHYFKVMSITRKIIFLRFSVVVRMFGCERRFTDTVFLKTRTQFE